MSWADGGRSGPCRTAVFGAAGCAQFPTSEFRSLSAPTPKSRPCHQGPNSTNREEASRRKKPRYDLRARPRLFGAVTRESEQINGYPKNAEHCHGCDRECDVSYDSQNAFFGHDALSHAPATMSGGGLASIRCDVRFPPISVIGRSRLASRKRTFRLRPLADVPQGPQDERMKDNEARRWPWWTPFVGPTLGIACSRLIGPFIPPVGDIGRQVIVAVVAIGIAGMLTYAFYRFAPM